MHMFKIRTRSLSNNSYKNHIVKKEAQMINESAMENRMICNKRLEIGN